MQKFMKWMKMILEITCETNDKWGSCRDRPVKSWIREHDQNDEDRALWKIVEALEYFSRTTLLMSMQTKWKIKIRV